MTALLGSAGFTVSSHVDAATDPVPATQPVDKAAARRAELSKLWGSLADLDPNVRESARMKLMSMRSAELPTFRKLISESLPVLPSQAAVLREVVTQVFLQGQPYQCDARRGFLGVRLGQVSLARLPALPPDRPNNLDSDGNSYGVVILERMPGFVGSRMFQDGDVVLGIAGGAIFDSADDFRDRVRLLPAGRTVPFQVLRQGRVIEVPVVLDPFPDDADFNPGGPSPMQRLLDEREQAVREFWDRDFAPLLKEGVG